MSSTVSNPGPLKISELPVAELAAPSDRLLILSNAASNSAVTSTVSMSGVFSNASFIPGPYANDSSASTAGVPVKGTYYDLNGLVHVRII